MAFCARVEVQHIRLDMVELFDSTTRYEPLAPSLTGWGAITALRAKLSASGEKQPLRDKTADLAHLVDYWLITYTGDTSGLAKSARPFQALSS